MPEFKELLHHAPDEDFRDLRDAESTGRPLGTSEFVAGLEAVLGRNLARRAPGRKPASSATTTGTQLELLWIAQIAPQKAKGKGKVKAKAEATANADSLRE